MLNWAGRAAESIAENETALRLSPRDPGRNFWQYGICHAYTHLAQWEKAVEWCQKSIATDAGTWFPHVDLAAASAWPDHDAEAKAAIAGLLKVYPGFTVQTFADVAARVTYNRPSPTKSSAYSKDYARRGCLRGRRRRIERADHSLSE